MGRGVDIPMVYGYIDPPTHGISTPIILKNDKTIEAYFVEYTV
jgi:hypothetical protein